MLAPRCVPHDQSELLVLEVRGEVFGGEVDNSRGRRGPVGVVHFPHVGHDAVVGPGTRVRLELDSLAEQYQGGIALNHELFGKLCLFGAVHFSQWDAFGFKSLSGTLVICKAKVRIKLLTYYDSE